MIHKEAKKNYQQGQCRLFHSESISNNNVTARLISSRSSVVIQQIMIHNHSVPTSHDKNFSRERKQLLLVIAKRKSKTKTWTLDFCYLDLAYRNSCQLSTQFSVHPCDE